MAGVRVLVGTRKGAFVLTADGRREAWEVAGPLFGGWEIYHVAGSPADPDRLWASQSNGWFGQIVQRSDDGGTTWEPVGNDFTYDGEPGTHEYYDGSSKPWEFHRVWHLAPSADDPDTVLAGVEDAALFRSTDGGESWTELAGLRTHASGRSWAPGAGGLCLHTILADPGDPDRLLVAISAAGVFASDDGGLTWEAVEPGAQLRVPAGRRRRGRPLRPQARTPCLASRGGVHAEALGRHAQRRRRPLLAGDQR
jgi:hypothetical protein